MQAWKFRYGWRLATPSLSLRRPAGVPAPQAGKICVFLKCPSFSLFPVHIKKGAREGVRGVKARTWGQGRARGGNNQHSWRDRATAAATKARHSQKPRRPVLPISVNETKAD